ncbi:MAG: hypothetical protein ACRECH_18020, partial [Nitrososphaerales archaeon]
IFAASIAAIVAASIYALHSSYRSGPQKFSLPAVEESVSLSTRVAKLEQFNREILIALEGETPKEEPKEKKPETKSKTKKPDAPFQWEDDKASNGQIEGVEDPPKTKKSHKAAPNKEEPPTEDEGRTTNKRNTRLNKAISAEDENIRKDMER